MKIIKFIQNIKVQIPNIMSNKKLQQFLAPNKSYNNLKILKILPISAII